MDTSNSFPREDDTMESDGLVNDVSAKEELEGIALAHDGILNPHDVVEFAENPDTALHSKFEWDDTEAAKLCRIHQARQIIRMTVITIDNPKTKVSIEVRQYVSLTPDRKNSGYRIITDVLKSEDYRLQMLEDAKQTLGTFRRKYAILNELAGVHKAIDKIMG